MAPSGNPGINKLGRILQMRMNQNSNSPSDFDLGTINPDLSLKTDTFSKPIPQSEYLVCRNLAHNPEEKLTVTAAGQDVVLPESMRWLQPGDRVLVAWVHTEAVVIDIVLTAKLIGG